MNCVRGYAAITKTPQQKDLKKVEVQRKVVQGCQSTSAILNIWLPSLGPKWLLQLTHFSTKRKSKRRYEEQPASFEGSDLRLYWSPSFTFHCMITYRCKEGWEMESLECMWKWWAQPLGHLKTRSSITKGINYWRDQSENRNWEY